MAPGFWGPTTSTLDWCEKNYEVRKKLFPFKNVKKSLNFIKNFGAREASFTKAFQCYQWAK
jgi:hypothetical protein